MSQSSTPTDHLVNPETDRCVLCGRNAFNRDRFPECSARVEALGQQAQAAETIRGRLHTPGPWKATVVAGAGVEVQRSVDSPICHMRWTDAMCREVEARVLADATLIAAAPELADALSKLRDFTVRACCGPGQPAQGELSSYLHLAEAALKKASLL